MNKVGQQVTWPTTESPEQLRHLLECIKTFRKRRTHGSVLLPYTKVSPCHPLLYTSDSDTLLIGILPPSVHRLCATRSLTQASSTEAVGCARSRFVDTRRRAPYLSLFGKCVRMYSAWRLTCLRQSHRLQLSIYDRGLLNGSSPLSSITDDIKHLASLGAKPYVRRTDRQSRNRYNLTEHRLIFP